MIRFWQRFNEPVPVHTHKHVFDSHYCCEPVKDFQGRRYGTVLYCSCGYWRVFDRLGF